MSSAVASPQVRRVTREEIVRLGQAGRPWEFLPIAFQALAQLPQDWGLCILAAANLARLGLRTVAREHLDRLPPQVATDPSVVDLTRVLEAIPSDVLHIDELQARCTANLDVLTQRGTDLRMHLPAWRAEAATWEWFAASDGNIVRRRKGAWRNLTDHRSLATRIVTGQLLAPGRDVFTLEGLDPPWLACELAARTQRDPSGYWPEICIIQADPLEFLDALAHADVAPLLGESRTRLFVGPDASRTLAQDLRSRQDRRLGGVYAPLLTLRTRTDPPVSSVLTAAEAAQNTEHESLLAQVHALYQGRDRAWWAKRYEAAAKGGPPLRILVPSCRFTTFVQHSGADLAAALRAKGHQAEVLIEADDSARLTSVSYLRAIRRLEPDLVILVNYLRQNIGAWFPRELPFVCWVQDAMPHLFDAKLGAQQTEFDFLAGHLRDELTRGFGFPSTRTLPMPVVASAAKFHPEPCDRTLLERFACEIALVSHQSETPERMHERLITEAGRGAPIEKILQELRPIVFEIGQAPHRRFVGPTIDTAARETLRRHLGAEPDAKLLTTVTHNYCRPLADRVLRHQTLHWAAQLAQERGWRLAIYGRGWSTHPTLAPYAKPELPHGEPLRAAYQAAAVHLHASINTVVHQRVMECALSGGLPLCRPVYEMFRQLHITALRAAADREAPTVCDPLTREHGHFITDHPEAAAYTAMLQRLGRPSDSFFWVHEKFRSRPPRARGMLPLIEANPEAWLLGDFGETTFESKERLGELVERAINCPGWRAGWSASIATRVREQFTHEVFITRLLSLVRSSFQDAIA